MGYADMNVKSGGLFLKVEPGVPKDIRLLDEAKEIYRHAIQSNEQLKSFDCEGNGCLYCQEVKEDGTQHSPPKQRFISNVWDHADKKVKLFEFGPMIAKQLVGIAKSLVEEGSDIMTVDLKVDATGSGLNRTYTVTPRMTSKPVPPDIKLLSKERKEKDIPF